MKPTLDELEAGLDEVRRSPREHGTLRMIVRRPQIGEREIVEQGALDVNEGLVGDSWSRRSRSANPYLARQLTLMNARVIALVAGEADRWPLAGDQLFVVMDLSSVNLPAGSRLAIGSAVIEISREPHTGCSKFAARFGLDAVSFVNSPVGKELRLRGVNARIVQTGAIRVGDPVTKTEAG